MLAEVRAEATPIAAHLDHLLEEALLQKGVSLLVKAPRRLEALIDAVVAVMTDLLLAVHLRVILAVILAAAVLLRKVQMNEKLPVGPVRGYVLAL